MRNIIFVPVGQELSFHEAYDKNNHWRYTKSNRDYEVIAYQYKDFDIEPDTYDYLVKDVGFKWDLAKHFLDTFDWRRTFFPGGCTSKTMARLIVMRSMGRGWIPPRFIGAEKAE